jgi:hypothetical protein
MPKFKILVTVVAILCSPVPLAMASTVVLSYNFDSPTNNPNAKLNTAVVLKLGSENEPTPALTPPPNSLMIMLRRLFDY